MRGRDTDVAEQGVEMVVQLDEAGRPCGSAPKADVHHRHTPLHLAFSCWVTDSEGRILITRRAWSKPTWPGVWTNAFCGHPGPGEPLWAAARRRARDELGVAIIEPTPVLPDFRYRAVMPNGVVENEVCPVFVADVAEDPVPHPDEVAEFQWIGLEQLRRRIDSDDRWFSPWAVRLLDELTVAGLSPRLSGGRSPDLR